MASRKTKAIRIRPTTTWVVHGESAYSGEPLSRRAAFRRRNRQSHWARTPPQSNITTISPKAQASYIKKLWNGEYFRYDTQSEYRDNIQADQLAGQWYADMTGLGDLVPHEMQHERPQENLRLQRNEIRRRLHGRRQRHRRRRLSRDNQRASSGSLDRHNASGFAGFMLGEGMKDEAYKTAWGIYHTTYETKGYWFRTPEAWDITGNYRASMYMRPAAIWAMEMTRPSASPAR